MRRVIRVVQEQRDARYTLLRGFFHGADDDLADDLHTERLVTLTLPDGALSIGKPIGHCGLDRLQVQVVSLRRGAGKPAGLLEETILMANDSLVLSGRVEQLALAEQTLLARK
jgi:monovalent cation:H+ antiporter-2, CPA2 family